MPGRGRLSGARPGSARWLDCWPQPSDAQDAQEPTHAGTGPAMETCGCVQMHMCLRVCVGGWLCFPEVICDCGCETRGWVSMLHVCAAGSCRGSFVFYLIFRQGLLPLSQDPEGRVGLAVSCQASAGTWAKSHIQDTGCPRRVFASSKPLLNWEEGCNFSPAFPQSLSLSCPLVHSSTLGLWGGTWPALFHTCLSPSF